MAPPLETQTGIATWHSNSTAGISPYESRNTNSTEPVHPNVHSSFIYQSQVQEAARVPITA